MNNENIKKIIQCSGGTCPTFKYEKPLLDIDVANKLAFGFVKLLDELKTDQKYEDLQLRILKNVRLSCKYVPDGHLCHNDDVTEMLINWYKSLLRDQINSTTDVSKVLDTFLIRNMKDLTITSRYPSTLDHEIIIALANLGSETEIVKLISKGFLYWNLEDGKDNKVLKSMWNKPTLSKIQLQHDDISLKNISEIEKVLLKHCKQHLEAEIIESDWFITHQDIMGLIQICSVSRECFQICCCILNTIFIKTDFRLQHFIEEFITLVKDEFITSEMLYFSYLYPTNLQHIVTLLDTDIDSLPSNVKMGYIQSTLEHLNKLHTECESDLVMLLSHYGKHWFEQYYNHATKSKNRT